MNNSLIGLRQPPYSQCTVGGSTVVVRRQSKGSGCIYFDKSLKETRHGRHIYHNKWCAEITVNNVRYRHRSKSRSACEEFISEMQLKHSIR
jgi:hypothetical protein